MDLLSVVRAGEATVIVVDNLFADPDLSGISAESRNAFLDILEEDAEAKRSLQAALAVETEDPRELLELALESAGTLWGQYSKDRSSNLYLFPLFSSIDADYAQVLRLNELVEHLTTFFGRPPKTYSSLDDARDALSHCAIAFVDLFIDDVMQLPEMLALHAQHRDSYQHGFDHQQASWPKLVILISTRIPGEVHLQSFREGAGVRSAFFKALPKPEISYARIEGLLCPWAEKYANAAQLHVYLGQLTAAVSESAERVIKDLNQIEVHDLAVLDAARLLVEGSSLHSYVGWLTSELIASRTRLATAQRAAQAPDRAYDGALDTVLLKESVLFDLFADVASSPPESDGHPQFGEILVPSDALEGNEVPVYVAMSPACDLARCPADFEVLLLRGTMKPLGRSAAELLQAGTVFGKGKHFLKYTVGGEERRGVIKWETKTGLITRPAGTLAKVLDYVRLGRMTELFAYELKDIAISQVSRVGLPVAPSVQRAGKVIVRGNFALGREEEPLNFSVEAPGEPSICALLTAGRLAKDDSESGVLMFTDEFRSWFSAYIPPQLARGAGNAKIQALNTCLERWSDWVLQFDSKGKIKAPFNDFTIKVLTELPTEAARGLEILVIAA